jgi:prevent-host-death family protein
MLQVNIHEAKTNLSKLIERASKGEEFIIAKAGRPIVKVIPIIQDIKPKRVGGFLKGDITIPADFDNMCGDEIVALFEGSE